MEVIGQALSKVESHFLVSKVDCRIDQTTWQGETEKLQNSFNEKVEVLINYGFYNASIHVSKPNRHVSADNQKND